MNDGSVRESLHAMTMVVGFCPLSKISNGASSRLKYSFRKFRKPAMNFCMSFMGLFTSLDVGGNLDPAFLQIDDFLAGGNAPSHPPGGKRPAKTDRAPA
jgi:hypothetical protein